jgi:hypothetical protein
MKLYSSLICGCWIDFRAFLSRFVLVLIFVSMTSTWAQQPLRFASSQRIEDGNISLNLETLAGTSYRVEKSSDLIDWELLTEFVATESVTEIKVSDVAQHPGHFYRASTSVDPLQAALNENRAKWASIGWKNYQLRIDVGEFIPREVSQGIVTVEMGQVVDVALPLSTGDNFGFRFNYPHSVEGLFDRLQSALDRDPVNAQIVYHADFGFPMQVFIDYDERIADEESGFRVSLLGPSRVEEAPKFEMPNDPYTIHSANIQGNTLQLDLGYGGGCQGHLFALLDLMPGAFAESEPPRPVIALRHDNNDDRCKALVRETRSIDLSPLAVSATKAYGSPIPMIIELGGNANTEGEAISLLYTPAGTNELLLQRATSQAWVGGVQGSGSGIDYRFRLTLLTAELPDINEVWIGQRCFEPSVQFPAGKTADSLSIGDVIEVLCHFRRVPVFDGIPFESEIVDWRDEPELTVGPTYEGAALIRYDWDGANVEIEVPAIDVLPELLFP